MEGLILAAKFSLGCNEVALFPRREKVLLKFLADPNNESLRLKTREVLGEFRIMFPYLLLIAETNGLNPFSPEVVEAYFIGNELLDRVPIDKVEDVVNQMYERKISLKNGFVPHHNFHLLTVLPKAEDQVIPPALLNFCMVRVGKVVRIESDGIIVSAGYIQRSNNGLEIVERREIIERKSVFVENLRIGNRVAIHWQHICEKLSPEQEKRLEMYTSRALKC